MFHAGYSSVTMHYEPKKCFFPCDYGILFILVTVFLHRLRVVADYGAIIGRTGFNWSMKLSSQT